MGIELRAPTEDDWVPMTNTDGRAFGFVYTEEDRAERRPVVDLSRFRILVDGGEIVGVAGSYALDMTVPGGTTVPTGGVTWVSVAATHRRQGLLHRLMEAVHSDIDDRGEPLAALGASEGTIYERFGYGVAMRSRAVTITKSDAAWRPGVEVPVGDVRFVDGADAGGHFSALWEQFRRQRPAEVSRSDAWHALSMTMGAKPRGGLTPEFYLAHPGGYAAFRLKERWEPSGAQHRMDITKLVAVTPEAHLALWHVLLNTDLVAEITTEFLPFDDPLPHLLANHRAIRTTSVRDATWVAMRDVKTCLEARTYGLDGELVIEADGVRWRLEASPEGATCRRVRSTPDLVTTGPGLSALLLGDVRPSELAAGRRLTGRNAEVLHRGDLMFICSPGPASQTWF